jgi:hypothetical protein
METTMMRRRLVPLLAVLLATSACSADAPEPEDRANSHSPEVSAELTAWMGDVCTADKPMRSVSIMVTTAPPVRENTTGADRKGIQTFLRTVLDKVGKTKKELAVLPEAPTAAGSKLVNDYRKNIDELYSTLFEYTENVEWFPAQSLNAPYRLALVELATFRGMPFHDNAALTSAFRRAPECR